MPSSSFDSEKKNSHTGDKEMAQADNGTTKQNPTGIAQAANGTTSWYLDNDANNNVGESTGHQQIPEIKVTDADNENTQPLEGDDVDGFGKMIKKTLEMCVGKTDDKDNHKQENDATRRPPDLNIPERHAHKLTDYFLPYHRKPCNISRPYGMGAVIIVPLFTGHLTGYQRDWTCIKELFEKTLMYKCYETTENCKRETLLDELKKIRDDMQRCDLEFDRMVCFILSHGEKDGILTCADNEGIVEEKAKVRRAELTADGGAEVVEKEENVITEIDEIVEIFKHSPGRLPKLKDMPKLFVIQACRGQETVKAAGKTNIGDSVDGCDVCPLDIPLKATVPVDADIEICYATTSKKYAFVDDNKGSWLIQDLLEAFRTNMSKRTVSEMLMAVRFSVSEKRARADVGGQAAQVPSVVTTMRREFWLDHLNMKRSTSSVELCGTPAEDRPVAFPHSASYVGKDNQNAYPDFTSNNNVSQNKCFRCHVDGRPVCRCPSSSNMNPRR